MFPVVVAADEVDEFIKLLDSRELAASADERLLMHLLLRADSINRQTLDWRKLKVWGAHTQWYCLVMLLFLYVLRGTGF